MRDCGRRRSERLPVVTGPVKPSVPILIEHEKRLVTELRELGTPARASANGLVRLYRTDDVNLLAVIHLVPKRLKNLANRRAVGVSPVHQTRDILEAHVAGL